MTTVKELKEFLETLPEDMSVEVLEEYASGWEVSTRWVSLELDTYCSNCCVYGGALYIGET
jgi:hypothetical protein